MKRSRQDARKRRHIRVRKKVFGTAERPRLTVYRSLKHIYAQVIDDNIAGGGAKTICSASTLSKDFGAAGKNSCDSAKKVGELIARIAQEKGVKQVVFDRGGYRYHGRVKTLAEAAREAGLQF